MVPLGDLAKRAGKLMADNSPAILTAIGVTGTLTTAYLTGRASFKAAQLIHQHPREWETRDLWLTRKEKARLVWKEYIPPALTATLTVAAIIGANHVGNRRAAALAAAYSLSERAFEVYRSKIIERLGDKKEQTFRDEIAQEQVTNNPIGNREVIVAGSGSVLCHEAYTGRYFISDHETLRRAQNDINFQVLNDSYASLTDFYELVGLPCTSVSDEVGWNSDKLLELQFSTTLTEDNRPCMVVGFVVAPVRHYNRLM